MRERKERKGEGEIKLITSFTATPSFLRSIFGRLFLAVATAQERERKKEWRGRMNEREGEAAYLATHDTNAHSILDWDSMAQMRIMRVNSARLS